jgi:hypothetical protein
VVGERSKMRKCGVAVSMTGGVPTWWWDMEMNNCNKLYCKIEELQKFVNEREYSFEYEFWRVKSAIG